MKFEDNQGRSWDLQINVGQAMALIEDHEVDLIEGDVNATIGKIMERARLRLDMAWTILKRQAKELEVTEDDFWNAIGPAQLTAINNCLKEAIVNFIVAQRPESASAIEATISKHGLLLSKQVEMQVQLMESPEVANKIEELAGQAKEKLKSELGKLSIDWPGPAAETSTAAPSGS